MTDWVPFYNGMPKVAVTDMSVNANGLIYASTFGRGAWLSTRRAACVPLITVSGVHNGSYYYEASAGANVTLTSPASGGNEIYVHTGDSVVLKPGFEVLSGAFFKGYIAPCSNGGLPTAAPAGQSKDGMDVPHIKEIKPKAKLPLEPSSYFQLVKGILEFNLVNKGIVKMMLQKQDGSWALFYPEDIFYPGFYSIPAPEYNFTGIRIFLDGHEIKQVK
jgi:PKD repeat protein